MKGHTSYEWAGSIKKFAKPHRIKEKIFFVMKRVIKI